MQVISLPEKWNTLKIIDEIGSGSFGIVYEAEDINTDESCAIKVIQIPKNETERRYLHNKYPVLQDYNSYLESVVVDIMREIKTLTMLEGISNIMSFEDYFVEMDHDKGICRIFIRMPLAMSFKDWMKFNPIDQEIILRLGIQISNALSECHKLHIIHRDLKPENIMVGDDGNFLLADFGIAAIMQIGQKLEPGGTYNFMAPEVHRMENYDARADQYSLGIILYTLLNNNRDPFINPKQPIVTEDDRKEAMIRRINAEDLPLPFSAQNNLGKVILKACEFNPDDRFENIEAFKYALENPDSITENTKIDIESNKKKNNKNISILISCAVIAIVAIFTFWNNSNRTSQINDHVANASSSQEQSEDIEKIIADNDLTDFVKEGITTVKLKEKEDFNVLCTNDQIADILYEQISEMLSYNFPNLSTYIIGESDGYIAVGVLNSISENNEESDLFMSLQMIIFLSDDKDGVKFDYPQNSTIILNNIRYQIYPDEMKEAIDNNRMYVDLADQEYIYSDMESILTNDYSWTDTDIYIPDITQINVPLIWENEDRSISALINLKNGTNNIQPFKNIDISFIDENNNEIFNITSDDLNSMFVNSKSTKNVIVTIPYEQSFENINLSKLRPIYN